MKVAIITMTTDLNFGNRLQNYALEKYLQNLGIEAETILDLEGSWHRNNFFKIYFRNTPLGLLKDVIKFILNLRDFRINFFADKGKHKKFIDFNRRYINWSTYTVVGQAHLENLSEKYDYFIVGSDQIWGPSYKFGDLQFLRFTEYHKRVAYAASLGTAVFPTEKVSSLKEYVQEIPYVSVREKTAENFLREITQRSDILTLVDPTMLLNFSEWKAIIKKPTWFFDDNEAYLLVYFIGTIPLDVENEINSFAKSHNLCVINLMNKIHNKPYSTSPDEFLYCVKNAKVVYTNSYHGTVFSILFSIPVEVFSFSSMMDSRFDTLLELFGIKDRFFVRTHGDRRTNTWYLEREIVNKVLLSEKRKTASFFYKALNMNYNI